MYELRIADPYIHRCQITNLPELNIRICDPLMF